MFNEHKEVAQYFLSFANNLESKNQEEGLDSAVGSVELEVEDAEEAEGKPQNQATSS